MNIRQLRNLMMVMNLRDNLKDVLLLHQTTPSIIDLSENAVPVDMSVDSI